MRCHSGSAYVLATSGLGNQLFQLAASHFLNQGSDAGVVALGNERQHIAGSADISGFRLQGPAHVVQVPVGNGTKFARKIVGKNQAARAREKAPPGRFALLSEWGTSAVASALLARHCGLGRRFKYANGIGYDPSVALQSPNELWLGYFQTWRYTSTSEMKSLLGGPSPESDCQWFDHMKQRAQRARPLVVHVRLGDYTTIPGVGIPDLDYYSRAIGEAVRQVDPDSIWLFSDDPQGAVALVPSEVQGLDIQVVEPPQECSHPATVMSVMSMATGFVLANSTFGYWAARLSECPGANIFVPDPWFPHGPEIRDLIPPDWVQISRG